MRNAMALGAAVALCAIFGATGCTSYQLAKDLKMVSFEDNVTAGRAVGPVRGEDCQGFVLGFPTGEDPTLDDAFADVRKQNGVRYLNNVSTENTGFDAFVYAQRCIVVRGTGYQ
jgi:hypothetical protein